MKKGLVLALALLTVFAMLGCDTEEKVEPPPPPPDEYFVPPAEWVGFSDEEMLAGQFYIGYGGLNPVTTSIEKKGSAFEVKTKTLTTTTSRQSVVWFNFDTTIFQKGYYVSLTLPTAGGNARPTNIFTYPIPEGSTNGSAGVIWSAGMDANTNGEQPKATFDGKYVVGDLKIDWRNADAAANLTGLSFWFQWDEDATLGNDNIDYVFTINTIKVNKSGVVEPPEPPLEGWDAEASLTKKVELGDFTWDNNATTQRGWRSNGTDSTVTDLAVGDLVRAKYLVLELDKKPTGGFQVVWQGNRDSPTWAWNQVDVLDNNGIPIENMGTVVAKNDNGYILAIDFSIAFAEKNYNLFRTCTQAKILISYYSPDLAGMGILKAYLGHVWEAPASWKALGPLNWTNAGNPVAQQGWAVNGHDGIETNMEITDVVNAKYLVLETKNATNAWGYGGIDIALQSAGTQWSQTALVTGWLSHSHPEDQIFLFVIELANLTGWSSFINYEDDPTKGFICVGMFNDGPIVMMGLQNGYLVSETLTKPADATDLLATGSYITGTLP